MADRIAIASDHAAVELKAELFAWLREQGHSIVDLGPATADSVDYPDYGYKLADMIASGQADKGIGISIAVNRNPACRCARVSEGLSARLARQHNDANVIAFGERLVGIELAKDIISEFLNTPFEGGRHQRRVEKLSNPQITKEPA
jgi:ribose 5-phosphate isomerase B